LLLEFYAPWCSHCKTFEPSYKIVATKLAPHGFTTARVDIEANPAIGTYISILLHTYTSISIYFYIILLYLYILIYTYIHTILAHLGRLTSPALYIPKHTLPHYHTIILPHYHTTLLTNYPTL
ncbi:hypothetical protein B484DRAFT_340994, partial [Ochromonadaceae sp. CCMP2298]